MPWDVERGHGCPADHPWAVFKTDTGEKVACHITEEDAREQVAALYANESEAGRAETSAKTPYGPKSQVKYADPGYQEDGKARYPLDTEAHIRAAWSYINQDDNAAKYSAEQVATIKGRIKAAGKKMGIKYSEDTGRSDTSFAGPQMFVRSFPLEDIRILTRAQGSEFADGRTVEALVAVWDRDAEISDDQGHYLENIARTAFDKAISESRPQGTRTTWRTGVFYNHGLSLYGTPSDRFSVPLGSPQDIKVTDHGLLTVTRYNETPLADEILETIRSGDVTGHSFTGRIIKSDPARAPRRGYVRSGDGSLQRVRRLELGLKEYGPTPFPAYADTAVVGIRSMLAGLTLPTLLSATPEQTIRALVDSGYSREEITRMAEELEPADADTPPDEGAVSDEPPTDDVEHSSRNSLLQRIAAAKTIRPGLAQPTGSDARRTKVQAITRPEGEGSE